MIERMPRRALLAGVVAAVAHPVMARAQGMAPWPARPIKLIVPFAPGGTTDLVARILAQGLQERLGQPVIIENKPGAGATVGSQMVAQATPDGYTLLMSNVASHGVSPALYRNLHYDAVRDFSHIALVVSNPSVFVANPRFPPGNLQAVVAYSHRRDQNVAIASSGSGSTNHLLIMEFARVTGADVRHVPYRGAGPAMTDTIAGVVPMMSDSLPSSVGHLRGGAVKALGMASAARHPAFPEVATFREQGIDLASTSWFGVSGPAGMPAAIVARLHGEIAGILAQASVRTRFEDLGSTLDAMSAEEYASFIAQEVARWAPVVQASGATVD